MKNWVELNVGWMMVRWIIKFQDQVQGQVQGQDQVETFELDLELDLFRTLSE